MNKLKVMIVDDSFVIRTVIKSVHNEEKYDLVAIAHNGADAVEMVQMPLKSLNSSHHKLLRWT